ncbi:MAG: ATPase-like, ParA/MinD [candidate division TA06 bacterium 32_111]|uniref:ATPase-like, ParA/MinD n=2 Tax=Bacteria candidate phyla TaxID=1783234 RepID=A0A124G069_UNCT6|nr:MAG: ATPase-like, ParA/MinD [candidate division TA06 bacterium 32_111]KUK86605.1 MAG: ATPase-like, ParA/MinD [candidate division TA06 bacterium 34_109]HAF07855.1 ATPase [candidate division WOR-3 bacterium]HCP17373.1 ATPase [candidate division WOR-3 bacterium]
MIVAIASDENKLSSHFGHCSNFFIYEIDNGNVKFFEKLTPPPHEPGVIPSWLSKIGIDAVITGGIGIKARTIFESKGIKVYDKVISDDVENVAKDFAKGELKIGKSTCDHEGSGENHHKHNHDEKDHNCRNHQI